MQEPQRKIRDITRLLSAFRQDDVGDPADAFRNFLLAVDDYPADDVETAVNALIKGTAPGVNPAFPQKNLAPLLGAECQRQMHLRLDHETRIRRPALPKPDVEHSPESRARVAAMVAKLANKLATPEPARTEASKARGEADTRWLLNRGDLVEEPGNPYPVSRTLLRQFEVGDPEAEADAA